jgi:hypothetical protein
MTSAMRMQLRSIKKTRIFKECVIMKPTRLVVLTAVILFAFAFSFTFSSCKCCKDSTDGQKDGAIEAAVRAEVEYMATDVMDNVAELAFEAMANARDAVREDAKKWTEAVWQMLMDEANEQMMAEAKKAVMDEGESKLVVWVKKVKDKLKEGLEMKDAVKMGLAAAAGG